MHIKSIIDIKRLYFCVIVYFVISCMSSYCLFTIDYSVTKQVLQLIYYCLFKYSSVHRYGKFEVGGRLAIGRSLAIGGNPRMSPHTCAARTVVRPARNPEIPARAS